MSASKAREGEQSTRPGLLVDTNLLILLTVGACNPSYIKGFKRTSQFSIPVYERLSEEVRRWERILSIPHVLTEVSNLLGQASGPLKQQYFLKFAEILLGLEELNVPSRTVVESNQFPKFGLTDLVIIEAVRGRHAVITEDVRLEGYLYRMDVNVVSLQSLRKG